MKSKLLSRLLYAGAITGIVCLLSPLTAEASNINGTEVFKNNAIYVNEQKIEITVIEQNNYQLVPSSFFRVLGTSVQWDDATKTVHLSQDDRNLKLPVGKKQGYYKDLNETEWNIDSQLETRTTLIDGKSYVPLAYTAEKLGIQVEYDASLKAAQISIQQMNSLTEQEIIDVENSNTILDLDKADKTDLIQKFSDEDIYWLYRITEAEAGGESYEGRMAVAATILNRVDSEGWPNTVVETIFEIVYVNGKAYYQFEPVLNNYIYEVTPSDETMKAVQDAINGEDPTNGAVVFYNPEKTSNKWILSRPIIRTIGNHVFAK